MVDGVGKLYERGHSSRNFLELSRGSRDRQDHYISHFGSSELKNDTG
jgi:hypothetical protein